MSPLNRFEQLEYYFQVPTLTESRYENDGNGNPIYIGISLIPNADPDAPVWMVKKIYYSGTYVIRTQLPDDGIKYTYSYTQRATYFS